MRWGYWWRATCWPSSATNCWRSAFSGSRAVSGRARHWPESQLQYGALHFGGGAYAKQRQDGGRQALQRHTAPVGAALQTARRADPQQAIAMVHAALGRIDVVE